MRPALLACCAALACAADSSISYDGSSTVYPIIVAAAEAYAEVEPRFALDAKPTGSSAGFRSMLARSSTINGASRAISAKELAAAGEAKIAILEIPIAYDALSVVANPRNPWLKDLKTSELQALFSQGGPTSWKQVRAGFPDAKVTLYGPGSDSGTLDYFNEAILGKDRKIRTDYIGSEDDHVLVQGVASDVNAIGFMGLAYVIENAQVLRALAIDNGKGAVMPTRQSVVDASYTPLSRPIFVYMRADVASRPDVAGFVNYLLDKPELIESVGYVALPAAMREEIKARFAKRTTGSIFSGIAVGTSLAQAMGVESAGAAPPKPAPAVAPAPAPAPVVAAVAVAKPAAPAQPAWKGPDAVAYQRDLERLRAASLDLARRSLDEGATVEEIARRSAELKQQAEALAESFRTAPRRSGDGLSLAEASALAK